MPRQRPPLPDDATQNGPPLLIVEGEENTTLETPLELQLDDNESTSADGPPRLGEDDDDESTEVSLPKPR